MGANQFELVLCPSGLLKGTGIARSAEVPTSGFIRFESRRSEPPPGQKREQRTGGFGLADPGVGASNEEPKGRIYWQVTSWIEARTAFPSHSPPAEGSGRGGIIPTPVPSGRRG